VYIKSIVVSVFLKGQVISYRIYLNALTITQKRTGHQLELLNLYEFSGKLQPHIS